MSKLKNYTIETTDALILRSATMPNIKTGKYVLIYNLLLTKFPVSVSNTMIFSWVLESIQRTFKPE